MIKLWRLYFHTIRHLRVIQIVNRVSRKLKFYKPKYSPKLQRRKQVGEWLTIQHRPRKIVSKDTFRFLHVERAVKCKGDWDSENLEKLWRYNLHYFDDLVAEGADERRDQHLDLISRWIVENPPLRGTGWEPYPISIRVVNWIKWSFSGNILSEEALQSVSVQVRHLCKTLEYHLLGNHLLSNAKALIFAGCYFSDREAQSWLETGLSILSAELSEQILGDGGHFERSPMYHSLIYEDLLDLINLFAVYPDLVHAKKIDRIHETTTKVETWLRTMIHPDQEISFFNDSAFGIAPKPKSLFQYASNLAIRANFGGDGISWLRESGYIRLQRRGVVLLIDVGPIGPDYIPGHAHADTLSYELSIKKKRIIVNSGVSTYSLGSQRSWERSTAAHSTVEIDGHDSSEVWAAFRVGRRASVSDIFVSDNQDEFIVEARHDGYKRLSGKPIHRRRWTLSDQKLKVEDFISGSFHHATSRLYLHPFVSCVEKSSTCGVLNVSDFSIKWFSLDCDQSIVRAKYFPEFGRTEDNFCLEMVTNKHHFATELYW
jgi:uncharacterized heparinase superfamily protein